MMSQSVSKNNFTLFCLPYAGGNKYCFRQFENHSSPSFQIITLEYPGRGSRITETCIHDIHALVDDAYAQIVGQLRNIKYALYGHSMGGLIAFLLARKILLNKLTPPLHLFITGTSGPAAPSRLEKAYHLLSKEIFLEKIKALGGLPDQILNSEELVNLFEPILRSDFKANETYVHDKREAMAVHMTIITGADEDFKPEDIKLWQNESKYPIDFLNFPGGHFFIFEHANAIIQIIKKNSVNI